MSKAILITGAAGFLGSNLAADLVARGYRVIGYDNLSMGRLANLAPLMGTPQFEFRRGDVTDPRTFQDVDLDFDCIVHLAAFKIPRYGKAIETLRINYRGTENALDLAVRADCKCVLASTSDVYGRNPVLPFSEAGDSVIGSSKVARWSYAVSKLFDEHLGFELASVRELDRHVRGVCHDVRVGQDRAVGADDEAGSLAANRHRATARRREAAEELRERVVGTEAGQ